MLRAPNAGACLRCQAKFRRNSKWWESIREKEGRRAAASVYVCILFLSHDGITHSCRQFQESGVDNDAKAERPEHVVACLCLPNKCRFFCFENVLVSKNCRSNKGFSGRWSRIWHPCYHMRHQYQDAPRICQLLIDMSVSGGVPRAKEYLEMMTFEIFV